MESDLVLRVALHFGGVGTLLEDFPRSYGGRWREASFHSGPPDMAMKRFLARPQGPGFLREDRRCRAARETGDGRIKAFWSELQVTFFPPF